MKPFGKKKFKIPYLRGDRMIDGQRCPVDFREGFHGRFEPELDPWKSSIAYIQTIPSGESLLYIEHSKFDCLHGCDCGEGKFAGHFSVEEHYLIVKDFEFRTS